MAFSVSAIIASLHDVIIIPASPFFSGNFFLSGARGRAGRTFGYSVNESVVVFDRVRDIQEGARPHTPQVLDHAITSTISRTIITHASTQMMVLSMLLFGGETLYYFALALTIGICFGIYSSVLVCQPTGDVARRIARTVRQAEETDRRCRRRRRGLAPD